MVAGTAAVVLAGAGTTAFTSGVSVTSLSRIAFATAALAAVVAAVSVLATAPAQRTVGRCLIWALTVPAVVGVFTGAMVWSQTDDVATLLPAVLPWVVAPIPVGILGPRLPGLPLLSRIPGTRNRTRPGR